MDLVLERVQYRVGLSRCWLSREHSSYKDDRYHRDYIAKLAPKVLLPHGIILLFATWLIVREFVLTRVG
jgi:hypothetical protein